MAAAKSTARKAAEPILENEYVKELLEILRENKVNAGALTGILNNVASMEREINSAIAEVTALRGELAAMREERNHPAKTMLEKAAGSLLTKLNAVKSWLETVKNKIIEGCKNAVESFKENGVTALNGIAGFFDVRGELEAARDSLDKAINQNNGAIAKIETASREYHAAGRAVKNIGRVIAGKEPIPDVKPNGTLARLIESPFRAELAHLNLSRRCVNKILSGIEGLEKAAALQAERDRPSALGDMKAFQVVVDQNKKEVPTAEHGKKARDEVAV